MTMWTTMKKWTVYVPTAVADEHGMPTGKWVGADAALTVCDAANKSVGGCTLCPMSTGYWMNEMINEVCVDQVYPVVILCTTQDFYDHIVPVLEEVTRSLNQRALFIESVDAEVHYVTVE